MLPGQGLHYCQSKTFQFFCSVHPPSLILPGIWKFVLILDIRMFFFNKLKLISLEFIYTIWISRLMRGQKIKDLLYKFFWLKYPRLRTRRSFFMAFFGRQTAIVNVGGLIWNKNYAGCAHSRYTLNFFLINESMNWWIN